jgi:SlyX protein
MTPTERRLDDLEIRIAHQDRTIAELNEVVTQQWKQLEAMERKLRRFAEELETMDAGSGPGQQKPPHY